MVKSHSILTALISALSGVFIVPWIFAASIEVVEGQPDSVNGSDPYNTHTPVNVEMPTEQAPYATREYNVQSTAVPMQGNSSNGELFIKVQQLEAEVRALRGLLEQQTYLLDQLSQRRLDDYIDLDRRISELRGGQTTAVKSDAAPATKVAPASAPSPQTAPSVNKYVAPASKPPAAATADTAKLAYRQAYQKVKDRKFDEAKIALAVFASDFPDSQYVPNAHFWLGELYYLDSRLEKARDSYYILVTEHSNHRKVADAKFKLGKIYHQLGNNEQAKTMLQSVLSDHANSKAADPAREYLKNSLQ